MRAAVKKPPAPSIFSFENEAPRTLKWVAAGMHSYPYVFQAAVWC